MHGGIAQGAIVKAVVNAPATQRVRCLDMPITPARL